MNKLIRIGHSAYRGDNAVKTVCSKAAAVRELRARGVLRNDARAAVNKACSRFAGYETVRSGQWGDVIEICNMQHAA